MKRRTVAILCDYVARATAGLVLAAPLTAAVAASGISAFPEGDRLLFEPGGLLLVEVARASWALFPPLLAASLATGTVLSVLLLVPQAVLWTALAGDDAQPLTALLGGALRRVPALLALHGLCLLAQVLTCAIALWLTGVMHQAPWGGAPSPDCMALAGMGLGVLVALVLGVLRDLASAAVACGAPTSRAAMRVALACFARSPGPALARWLGPAVLGLSLVSAAALAVGALDVGQAGAARFLAVAGVHQAVVLALTVCRAVCFGAAVALVRLSPARAREPDDRPEHSAEQADPS